MRTFQLSERFFKRLRTTYLTVVPALIVAVGLSMLAQRGTGTELRITLGVLALVSALVAVTMIFTLRRAVRSWRTFRITIDGSSIARTQDGYDSVTIRAGSIGRITEAKGRGLSIFTEGSQAALRIPDTLDHYDECRGLLGQWARIDARPTILSSPWLAIPLVAAMVGVVLLFDRVTDPTWIIGLGSGLALLFAVSVYRTQRNPDVDRRAKRTAWLTIVPLARVLLRVLHALVSGR